MTTTYNGWTNRETWVFNLHMGDAILDNLLDLAEDGYFDDADTTDDIQGYIEAYSENWLEECCEYCITGSAASMIMDLLDLSLIDHHEISTHFFDDVCTKLEEQGYKIDTEAGTFELPEDLED